MNLYQYLFEAGLVILVLYASYSCYTTTRQIILINKALKWIKVKGKLLDARVLKKNVSNEKHLLTPKICFFAKYKIGDIRFGCDTVSLYLKPNLHERAYFETNIESEGDTITLYVNKNSPHHAVWLPPAEHRYLLSVAKCVFLLTAIVVVLFVQR